MVPEFKMFSGSQRKFQEKNEQMSQMRYSYLQQMQ